MHVGVLTGGGDVPGLNAAIKSIYRAAKDRGWLRRGGDDADVTGIRRGWMGAVQMGEGGSGSHLPLTDQIIRTVDRSGGTFLHTSRTRPDRMRLKDLPPGLASRRAGLPKVEGRDDLFDLTDEVIGNLRRAGIECLVAIGGDDTLGYAYTLSTRGFPVVGIPKTMDNDVRGTEYALGFQTALTRADHFINRQRTHLGSNETVGVFRLFGRNAGFTALGTAMAISDIRCAIPEQPFDLEALCRRVQEDYEENENHYALVCVSEGAIWQGGRLDEFGPPDAYGHRRKSNVGEALAEAITRHTGLPTRHQDLTYDLRSGNPDAFDKIVANIFGTLSIDLIAQGTSGRMLCLKDGLYAHTDLPDAARGARTVDVAAHYDAARFRPNFSGLMGRPLFP